MKVCFLLPRSDHPRRDPLVAETRRLLTEHEVEVVIRRPERAPVRLDRLHPRADLYLLKSDSELALSLATVLEGLGVRVINSAKATARARNKVVAAAVLRAAGLRLPRSLMADKPAQLVEELSEGPLILKPYLGHEGAEVAVVDTPASLPAPDAYPELVFAQQCQADTLLRATGNRDFSYPKDLLIPPASMRFPRVGGNTGWSLLPVALNLTVFAIGAELYGVREASVPDVALRSKDLNPLSPQLEWIVHRCGEALGLELYSVDVAETEEGPVVMDVTAFPDYQGVPEAGRRLAEFILNAGRR